MLEVRGQEVPDGAPSSVEVQARAGTLLRAGRCAPAAALAVAGRCVDFLDKLEESRRRDAGAVVQLASAAMSFLERDEDLRRRAESRERRREDDVRKKDDEKKKGGGRR